MADTISFTLKVWRQEDAESKGRFQTLQMQGISTDMSFLEMLDVANSDIERSHGDPIAFDHDCREGICGMCGAKVNGQ